MKCYCDGTLYFAIIFAHVLMFFSFSMIFDFWISISLSMLLLSIFAIKQKNFKEFNPNLNIFGYGIISGIALYLLFKIGKELIFILKLPLINDLQSLYTRVIMAEWWHYLLLFLIVIPGEELFWRGYLQKKLTYYFTSKKGIIYASLLYASANIYADSILLILSALTAGIVWGSLYYWKKNIWISIISHSIFNLLLLVIFPLL